MRFTFILLLISSFSFGQAGVSGDDSQGGYSLRECIDYALEHNVTLRQTRLAYESSLNQLEASKFSLYPTVNGQFSLNSNFGRNIDPFSNDVVTQTIGTNRVGVGSSVTLYNGGRLRNTIESNKLGLKASQLDIQAQKNNISLQVAVSYLNVLSARELVEVSVKNLEVTQLQLERTNKLVDAGALSPTNVFDLEAQLANNELQLVNARNNVENAKLTLLQAMNMIGTNNFTVEGVNVPQPSLQPYPQSANEVYQAAINFLPEVTASETREEMAQMNIEIAKSVGLPSIAANASWGTAYSTAAKNLIPTAPTFSQVPITADVGGETIAGIINFPQQNFDRENIPYFSQFGNNQNMNVGVSMNIPIFNGFNKKFQTQGAKIQKMQAELNTESTQLNIRQSIEQAFITMLNASKSYIAATAQVNALEKSFVAAESRYSQGASNFVDYNLAKTNLDRALANEIQTKYDYLFRLKILDFYQNKPLTF
ncbi:outer membrane protein [Spirosomataceae bacterium TFI 002]|nr:outer membrane protein [Spirosomataceae bacterium TFI 002]